MVMDHSGQTSASCDCVLICAFSIDVGASQKIIDGKIKLKNDAALERFTKNGLKFADGSELPADVVLFATG